MTFIKIAIRNVFRNKRRSLITISAVGFGLGALIFIWAFVDGAHKQMVENYTALSTGHIQIHQKGFHQKPKLEIAVTNPTDVLATIRQTPRVRAASVRIKADGLISSSESSSGVLIVGIDPDRERTVSTLAQRVKSGQFLASGQDHDIILGKGLAQNLNVALDDKVVIMSQALDGSIATGAFRVRGLLDTGADEIDKGIVLVTLKAAQDVFVMPGKVSEITVRLISGDDAAAVARNISSALSFQNLEVLPWQEVSPMMQQWIQFDEAFVWIIVIVVMIVVAIGILNTVLMGVLERTREFGILLAIGTKRIQVVTTVALESAFLGLLGSIAGLVIGLSLSYHFGRTGINLTVFTSALNSFYMDPFIYPIIHCGHVVLSVILVFVTSIIVAVYPSWHAANLKPVDAIRSI